MNSPAPVRIILDDSVIGPVCRDLRNLMGDGKVVWVDRCGSGGLYFPPGLYYHMPSRQPGRPILWCLPPPHHPIEVLAAARGCGGLWYDGIDTDRIIAAARALRGARWVEQTEKFAEYLFLTPPQVRLLYHLFTPLRLGGLPVWGDPARSMRERLYEAMSPTVDSTGLAREAFEQAWSEPKEGEHIPARTDFWTKELYGDINL